MQRSLGWCMLTMALCVAPATAQNDPTDLTESVTLSFKDTRLALVVSEIQDRAQINIVVHPAVQKDSLLVTAAVSGKPLSELLDQVQKQLGLKRSKWCGAIYLHPKDKSPPKAEKKPPEGKGSLSLRQVYASIKYNRIGFRELKPLLEKRLNIKMRVRTRVYQFLRTGDRRVTLRLFQVEGWRILTQVLAQAGLDWSLKDGMIHVEIGGKWSQPNVKVDELKFRAEDSIKKGKKLSDIKLTDAMPAFKIKKHIRELYSARTRRVAITALTFGGKQVLPRVHKVLTAKSADTPTRLAALSVISKIGDSSSVEPVLTLFDEVKDTAEMSKKERQRYLKLRSTAGATLGRLGSTKAIPSLIKALDDDWFKVSETARRSLVDMGGKAVKQLEEAFDKYRAGKGHDGLIYRALLILGEINTPRARAVLLKAIRIKRGDRAVAIRHHSAIGLGYTDDPNVIKPLIAALRREEENKQFLIAKYVTRSLSWITGEKLPPASTAWRTWWLTKGKKRFADRITSEDILVDHGGAITHKKKSSKYGDIIDLDALSTDKQIASDIAALHLTKKKERPKYKRGVYNLRAYQDDDRKKAFKALYAELKKVKDKRIRNRIEWVISKMIEDDDR